jgi:aldose 1-epimerase
MYIYHLEKLLQICIFKTHYKYFSLTETEMITEKEWGEVPSGQQVYLYTLQNESGMKVCITNYGATVVELWAPDRNGELADVVLGYNDLNGYKKHTFYIGAVCGRYANRIANGEFTLDGHTYRLARNNGPNALHGGIYGFDKRVWNSEIVKDEEEGDEALELTYVSPDGHEGYPGEMQIKVTYRLTNDGELDIRYQAVTDKKTVVNLTNHSYFNLTGAKRDVLDHVLKINSDKYTIPDDTLIPTGETPKLTPELDFRTAKAVGRDIKGMPFGYDHNFIINGYDGSTLRQAAVITDPESGRKMEVLTTEPGMQLYTSFYLDGSQGKDGISYKPFYGVCFEAQHFPDSPNKPQFPSTILNPGDTYIQHTVYRFSTEG